MPARNQRIASNLDGPTVVLFLLLAGLGWWNLVSASTGLDGAVEWSLGTLHGKQALWLVASLILGALILQVEGEFFIRTAWLKTDEGRAAARNARKSTADSASTFIGDFFGAFG